MTNEQEEILTLKELVDRWGPHSRLSDQNLVREVGEVGGARQPVRHLGEQQEQERECSGELGEAREGVQNRGAAGAVLWSKCS